MTKLLKIFRGNKKRHGSTPSSQLGKKKSNGIFRSNVSKKSTIKVTEVEPPLIEAAITYTLSEDDESCDIVMSADTDIENRISTKELGGESTTFENVVFHETSNNVATNSVQSSDLDCSKNVNEHDKTVTFTHLEIMRNELTHMMQIANKDKEIWELQEATEELRAIHSKELALKDGEIAEMRKVLAELESALSLAGTKLESAEDEHTKTIEVLMKTQYDYHELKNASWFQPMWDYFD